MDIDFFKTTRILDGGMGQELLARGMKPNGTLWSANAVLKEEYHQLLLDTHLDFIKAGAEVIVTATFTTRRIRLRDNKIEDKPQYLTYEEDTRPDNEIKQNFYDQAKLLDPYIDFFYLDVLSSVKEFKLAIEAIKEFNKPYLMGAHISEGVNLPSGEKISDIINNINHKNLLGLILSCVSPENFSENLEEVKNLGVPFGFKLNAFVTTKPKDGYTNSYNVSKTGNPNEFLGQRKDLTPELMANFVKKFKNAGATILGGCCETRPSHIKEMVQFK